MLQTVVALLIIALRKGTDSIFLNAIANDSMFSSVDLVLDSMGYASQRQNSDIISRYIYYTLLSAACLLFNLLTWWRGSNYIYWLAIVATHPKFVNYVSVNGNYKSARDKVLIPFTNALKYITCEFGAWVFNSICGRALSIDPLISHQEINYALESVKEFPYLLRAFVIALTMHHLERSASPYLLLVKFAHKYGFTNLPADDIPVDKEKITRIVVGRKWKDLQHPMIIKYLITAGSTGDIAHVIETIISRIESSVIRFFTIYTISTATTYHCAVVTSWCLAARAENSPAATSMRVLATILTLTNHIGVTNVDMVCLSLLCTCEFMDNPAFISIVARASIRTQSYTWILWQPTNHSREMIIYPVCLQLLACATDCYAVLFLVMFIATKPQLLAIYLALGILSGYNLAHMVVISVFAHVWINLNQRAHKPLKIDIMDEYEPGPVHVNKSTHVITDTRIDDFEML